MVAPWLYALQCGVQVVYGHDISHRGVAEIIGGTVSIPAFEAFADEPN